MKYINQPKWYGEEIDFYTIKKCLGFILKGLTGDKLDAEMGGGRSLPENIKKWSKQNGLLIKVGRKLQLTNLGLFLINDNKVIKNYLTNENNQETAILSVALSAWKISNNGKVTTVSLQLIRNDTGLVYNQVKMCVKWLYNNGIMGMQDIADLDNATMPHSLDIKKLLSLLENRKTYFSKFGKICI